MIEVCARVCACERERDDNSCHGDCHQAFAAHFAPHCFPYSVFMNRILHRQKQKLLFSLWGHFATLQSQHVALVQSIYTQQRKKG